jgi:hypothetical protein
LRLPKSCGYGAQEFISAAAESGSFDKAALKFANDSAGAKGGPRKGPPFSRSADAVPRQDDTAARREVEFAGVWSADTVRQIRCLGAKALS